MIPRLVTVLRVPPAGDPEAFLVRIPAGRRDRLTVAWPGAVMAPPLDLIVAARRAGFARVRLFGPASEVTAGALAVAVDAGVDEVELLLDAGAPWRFIRDLRASGRLAYVALRQVSGDGAAPGLDPSNPCGADAYVLEVPPSGPGSGDDRRLGIASPLFRRLAVRGWPLCAFPSLAEDHVISNALVARTDGSTGEADAEPCLRVPFEAPSRVFSEGCGGCRLALACDGIPAVALAAGQGGLLHLRPFGPGNGRDVPLSPGGIGARSHPPSFLSGRVHVLGVSSGARACGRIVVDPADAARQVSALHARGLHTAEVPLSDALRDRDTGAGARGAGLHQVFFSLGDQAREAADLVIRYARSQDGDAPLDPAGFSRSLGRLLGYPECCIEAFTAAGPGATTSSLLRAAHHRTGVFHWQLNVLDPVSPFTLVPHLPCRFDCPASLDLASRLAAVLDDVYPFLQGAARQALGRPWLWWDATRGMVLQGPVDADASGAACGLPDSPLLRPGIRPDASARAFLGRVLPALASGDHVRLDGPAARVTRGGEVVALLDEGITPLIFPFDSR
jgi:hypothetical protein